MSTALDITNPLPNAYGSASAVGYAQSGDSLRQAVLDGNLGSLSQNDDRRLYDIVLPSNLALRVFLDNIKSLFANDLYSLPTHQAMLLIK
jgi:hypothetical protein